MNASLADKVAMVTGAASGIGRATALAYAAEGAIIIVSDLASQIQAGQLVVAEIEAAGGRAIFIPCDVTREDDIRRTVDAAVAQFGRLDIACNNAGYQCAPVPLTEVGNDDWDRIMSINLKGVWWCMKYQISQMLKQGGGIIVNVASLAGVVGLDHAAPYAASKHGVIGLTKSAALEYVQRGIRINAVCPGLVITRMVRDFVGDDAAIHQQLGAGTPIGRPGTPEEIASAILWLSSPGASFATGMAMNVDGGWVAR